MLPLFGNGHVARLTERNAQLREQLARTCERNRHLEDELDRARQDPGPDHLLSDLVSEHGDQLIQLLTGLTAGEEGRSGSPMCEQLPYPVPAKAGLMIGVLAASEEIDEDLVDGLAAWCSRQIERYDAHPASWGLIIMALAEEASRLEIPPGRLAYVLEPVIEETGLTEFVQANDPAQIGLYLWQVTGGFPQMKKQGVPEYVAEVAEEISRIATD